jgi:arabinose-5-phosphate isomerase
MGDEQRDLSQALASAREAISIEAAAVRALEERVDDRFARAVELILGCSGRVVVTGMGKSGAVGRKLAATLASTGTPSLFLHPAEGLHGDLGMVAAGDVLIVLSQSGWTDEVTTVISAMKRISVPIIAFTGRDHSPSPTRPPSPSTSPWRKRPAPSASHPPPPPPPSSQWATPSPPPS